MAPTEVERAGFGLPVPMRALSVRKERRRGELAPPCHEHSS